MLFNKGANINHKDINGCSYVMNLCRDNDSSVDSIKFLLSKGADINEEDDEGKSCLTKACERCDLDIVEFLLPNGANFKRMDNQGWSPVARDSGDVGILYHPRK